MKPSPRPCFNPTLVAEISKSERLLEAQQGFINDAGKPARVDWVVFGSRVAGAFNLGGDLNLFIEAILRRDRRTIFGYASECIDNIYRRYRGYEANIGTVALVQGKAMGGGFECALASDVIIAEKSATFCLPETLFNLFPGMGALSFLGRRVGLRKAEEICTNGQTYTAKELFDIGAIDEVVEDGLGLAATRQFIFSRQRRGNTHAAFRAAKRFFQPISRNELDDIVTVWTDAALHLESRDLRMMARLVRAQDKLGGHAAEDDLADQLYRPGLSAANG
jgi:DSF synthase